jgi:hypothetical protein
MRGPGPEFQRDTIYWGIQAHLILEGQLRLRLIEDTINALCEVSRACGALIGQAT